MEAKVDVFMFSIRKLLPNTRSNVLFMSDDLFQVKLTLFISQLHQCSEILLAIAIVGGSMS